MIYVAGLLVSLPGPNRSRRSPHKHFFRRKSKNQPAMMKRLCNPNKGGNQESTCLEPECIVFWRINMDQLSNKFPFPTKTKVTRVLHKSRWPPEPAPRRCRPLCLFNRPICLFRAWRRQGCRWLRPPSLHEEGDCMA